MISSFLAFFAGSALAAFSGGFLLGRFPQTDVFGEAEDRAILTLFAVLAFAAVPLFGFISDKLRDNGRFSASAGLLLCALGLVFGASDASAAAVLCGTGFAAVLAGAGTDALTQSKGFERTGFFLAAPVIGFALGKKIGTGGLIPVQYPVALIVFAALAVFFLCRGKRETPAPESGEKRFAGPRIFLAAITFLSVFIISFVGFAAPAAEYEGRFAWLIPAAAAFAGCAAGGVAADIFGSKYSAPLALLVSAPLFYLGCSKFILYAGALFFLSAAAAAVVRESASIVPGFEGTSFGICTAALLCGFLVSRVLTVPGDMTVGKIAVAILAAASAAMIFIIFSLKNKQIQSTGGDTENGTEQA